MKKFLSTLLASLIALGGTGFADKPTNQNKAIIYSDGDKLIYVSHDHIAPLINCLQTQYKKYKKYKISSDGELCILGGAMITSFALLTAPTYILNNKIKNKDTWSKNKKTAVSFGLSAIDLALEAATISTTLWATDSINKNLDKEIDKFDAIGGGTTVYTRAKNKKDNTPTEKMAIDSLLKNKLLPPGTQFEGDLLEFYGCDKEEYGFDSFITALKQINPLDANREKCQTPTVINNRFNYIPAYTDDNEGIVLFLHRTERAQRFHITIYRQGKDYTPNSAHTSDNDTIATPCLVKNGKLVLGSVPDDHMEIISAKSVSRQAPIEDLRQLIDILIN